MLRKIQRIAPIPLIFNQKCQLAPKYPMPTQQHLNVRNSKRFPQNQFLSISLHYSYFTLVDKPIQSAALNSVVQLGAEFMTYPFAEWSCPTEASVILGGIAFRLIIELASKFIEDLKFSNHANRPLYKIVKKVFLVDLQRDINFYQLDHRKAYLLQKYYKVSYLLKNLFTAYFSLNFFRSCHFILNCDHFNSFHIHTLWVPTLASHDPSFLLPLFAMPFTYLWLTKSRHPLIIHLTRSQNFLYRINIAFMSGLLFVPLPSIYTLGYIGWMSGHLLIRTLAHEGSDLKEEWRDAFGLNKKFIQEKQRKRTANDLNDNNLRVEKAEEENHKK